VIEAVGTAASIAGILRLAGQSIEGIIKLRGFVKDVKSSAKNVGVFLRDVGSFQDSLLQIQLLLFQLPHHRLAASTPPDVICEPPDTLQSLN
jgi:hypothetical protein